jgi:hypothetical protein
VAEHQALVLQVAVAPSLVLHALVRQMMFLQMALRQMGLLQMFAECDLVLQVVLLQVQLVVHQMVLLPAPALRALQPLPLPSDPRYLYSTPLLATLQMGPPTWAVVM